MKVTAMSVDHHWHDDTHQCLIITCSEHWEWLMLRRHLRVSFALAESKPYAIDLIFDLSASPTLPPLPDEHFLTLLPLIPVNIERIVFIVHDSPMQQILETIRHDYVMAGFTSVICHNLAESIALLAELRHQQFDDRWH